MRPFKIFVVRYGNLLISLSFLSFKYGYVFWVHEFDPAQADLIFFTQ